MKKHKGYFIVFEGGEGSGKSIQVDILASHLREEGYKVVVTREPGGTRIGEQIRSITHNSENVDLDPKAEAYLMAGARAQHVAETIAPALDAGRIVLCDRFVDSSLAYQGYGRKLGAHNIEKLNEMAVNGASPDLTILLDVSPLVGIQRRRASLKGNDRLDLQQDDFYDRVCEGYRILSRNNPIRYMVVDGTKTIEQVGSIIWGEVQKRITSYDHEA